MVKLLPLATPYLASTEPPQTRQPEALLIPQNIHIFSLLICRGVCQGSSMQMRKSISFPKDAVYNSCDETALMA